MRILYHHPFIPACRTVRLALRERPLEFTLTLEKFWEEREAVAQISPTFAVPALVDEDQTTLSDVRVICEYLEDRYPQENFTHLGHTPLERAETRRLMAWFEGQFNNDVTQNLVFEKGLKQYFGAGGPTPSLIRLGSANLAHHMAYMEWLLEERKWLSGDTISFADFSAASHLSCIDYFGSVPWGKFPATKEWYARIKSRPSFRPLLADRHPGIPAQPQYTNLDF